MGPVPVPCSFCKHPSLWSTTTGLVETTDWPRTSYYFFQYTEVIFTGIISGSSPLVQRYKLASRKPRRFLLNAYGRSSNLSSSLLMSPDWSRVSFDVSPQKKLDFSPATWHSSSAHSFQQCFGPAASIALALPGGPQNEPLKQTLNPWDLRHRNSSIWQRGIGNWIIVPTTRVQGRSGLAVTNSVLWSELTEGYQLGLICPD